MTAVVNYGPSPRSVELREVPVPGIGEDEVLVAVRAVGVCGSDVHQYLGTHSWAVNYPVVLGHEFAGEIVRVGARVRGFPAGGRVVGETAAVVDPNSPLTRSGRYNLDPARLGFGYGVDGAMADFVRVPERCLHRIPDDLPFERAALTEPCCVAYNAVCVNSRIRPGDCVAVIGPGPIGLLCTMIAALSGADPLVVIGLPADADRLELAREVGATQAIGAGGEAPATEVRRLGEGLGADLVIDAAGVSGTLGLALELVRPGGQITKVGWGREPLGFSLDPLVAKNVSLQGSFSHTWPMWEAVLSLVAAGRLQPQRIVGRVAPLRDWEDSFEGMHRGEIVKAVLTLS
jgi:L-iditol 2-dehydrogenase